MVMTRPSAVDVEVLNPIIDLERAFSVAPVPLTGKTAQFES
jgi:hypothetical protein